MRPACLAKGVECEHSPRWKTVPPGRPRRDGDRRARAGRDDRRETAWDDIRVVARILRHRRGPTDVAARQRDHVLGVWFTRRLPGKREEAAQSVTGYCAYSLSGGDGMNDKPNWQVAHIDDIERRGRDIPVREHLGIHAFGINAYTPSEDGTLINEHDEAGAGQEELYIVLDGRATFEVDGETVDAPPGTLVFVGPESRRKATGDGTVLVVGGTPGEAY